MSSQPIQYQDCEDALTQAQVELLEALLQPQDERYPWNPAEPEAQIYFEELEQGCSLEPWQDEEEITSASQEFFEQLQQCWVLPLTAATDSLQVSLSEQFANVVPQVRLEAIASKAQEVFSSNISLVEQLVLCVQPLLPNWSKDDLFVFARPLASAMRGRSELVKTAEWTELSQIEQVRLSLTVARSALAQLKNDQANPE
ncbi:MAG: hypothetical protein F6J92_36060 [Symploca sp. SIO1A3]|nr:hypothetical protein [Symploca sp. SIO2C1]NER51967.1 hypothetical protein [Symploca sp. SIO1A3]